jgi:hypothetical protein
VTDVPRAAVPRSSRLKGAAAFVAIVWLVAASFIVFEVVALHGVDVFSAYPDTLGRYLLSDSTQASTACAVEPGERVEGTDPDIGPELARAAAWTLGLRVGEEVVVRQTPEAPEDMRERAAAAVQRLADSLSVPRPTPFTRRQAAMAYAEFVDYVEVDLSSTAHQVAVRYSPDACRLYKLGSFWGYSGLVRPAIPGSRSVHAAVIHHYARQLGLPDALWQPMVNRSPADGTVDSISGETRKLTEGMTKFLLEDRRP